MRLPALLLLACFAGLARGEAAAEPLQACMDAVFAGAREIVRDEPFTLRELCPELAEDQGLLTALPLQDAIGEDLTPAQLLDLRAAWVSTRTGPGPAGPLRPADLGPILEAMDTTDSEPSLWEQFRAWLLENLRSDNEAPSWLVEWLENLDFDGATAGFILKLLLAGIVLLAIGLVLNELVKADLRLSGAPSRRRPLPPQTGTGPEAADWDSLIGLPARQQPAALLQYLLNSLDRAGIIAVQRAWTNHEYAAAVRRRLPGASAAFARVVAAAEHAVYGGHEPVDEEARTLRRGAEQVRDALEPGA